VSLISSGNRSHEALVTYPVLMCPLVSPSYERDRVTDVALIAELSTAALWQRKACAAEGLTLIITRPQRACANDEETEGKARVHGIVRLITFGSWR
jgi:hypothetical protein